MDQLVGTTLGRYRIERLLAHGGMAWVYRAHDPAFGRAVAVKVLPPALVDDPRVAERFLREARSMARLQHPHILPVHDVGEQRGIAYLVMHYVGGGGLHERLAAARHGNRLSLREVLGIARPIADALDYAHRNGVIHRDVKPQNILLTSQGYPFLTDFGIAKIRDAAGALPGPLTHANAVIGTPDYMSPEQGRGQPLDGRSDLYSLGVILYEMFTGRTPFRSQTPAETPLAIVMRHITAPPPPPRAINPQLPQALEWVLLRALAKQPGDRYPTGAALLDALEAAAGPPRLPQSQGGVAAQSPTMHLNPPPPPLSSPPPPTGFSLDPGAAARAVAGGPPPQVSPVPRAVPAPHPVIVTPGTGPGHAAARRGRRGRPWLAIAGAAALLALAAFFGVRAIVGTGSSGGAGSPLGVVDGEEAILFSSHRNNVHNSQIYTMNPDGSGQRILLSTKGHSWGPRVSPDGQFLVFSVVIGEHTDHSATGGGEQGRGHHEIFRARTDGGDITQITTTGDTVWNNAWAWTPDGTSVVFASDRDGNWELYRMDADGSDVVRLTDNTAQDGWPTITPDGESIIFASDRDGDPESSQLYIMGADGEDVRRLVSSEAYDTLPSIAPDGKTVVYSSRSGSLAEIYSLDLATATTTRLTSTVAMNTDPSFSPDGSKIVFTSDRDGNTNIYVMDRDGKNQTRITDDPGEDVTPFWAVIELAAANALAFPEAVAHPAELIAVLPRRRIA
jgi:serine/threonine protein kinase/Tol biopolymer transport system component